MTMNLLHEPLQDHARRQPDKTAVRDGERSVTYHELWEKIQGFAGFLSGRFRQKARVGILLSNNLEAVVSIYAAPAAGMIAVPMDADIHPRNLDSAIRSCGISTLVTSGKFLGRLRDSGTARLLPLILAGESVPRKKSFSFEQALQDGRRGEKPLPELGPSDVACILTTAGTTDEPKAVMLSHANLRAASHNIRQVMGIDAGIVESLPMRISHSFGFGRLRAVLESGGTVILEDGLVRPERVLAALKEKRANALSLVPAGFAILLTYYRESFREIAGQLRFIEIGSAFMRRDQKEMLMELCPAALISMHYGLTEASRAAFLDFHREKAFLDTAGKPSPGVRIKIVDENGNESGPGDRGEILIRGDTVSPGYWGKPELTASVLKDGWLHTGDSGFVDENGYLHLLGRRQDTINLGGIKVSPREVEEVLLKYKGILEAAVVGVKSEEAVTGEIIKAFLVVDDREKFRDLAGLKKFCLREIEAYKVPQEFEIIPTLPKTGSGKVKTHLLAEPRGKKP